ncbi:glycosyltransferase family 4 protein [Pseudobacter ginsenosidimutans]|uniref:Glycosyltransferase involved in cell wall biosynthesis n=1 Tax=Pseudobacter ginsenosidimutans TaxID=661488 RepID=A0A4Q7MYB8_9BACT|nr:glycosyltransferase family 4 protein [Pseudobacter ginsenosidimutans]RZS72213.1 glycosyltransferase involved in cell wall biosynthesis [Pseudobacter ginsenosidimutans]
MQKHSFYLCKYLARNKVYVDLYHTGKQIPKPDLSTCFTMEELKYITSYVIPYQQSDRLPGHYLRTSHQYSKVLYERFRTTPPVDLIYAKGLAGWYLLEQKKSGEKLPPVLLNVHGYEYYQKTASFRNKLEQIILRPAFRNVSTYSDYIYSYGGKITDIIRKNIPNASQKIIEIPTGIERDFITDNMPGINFPRQFVYLGRFERRKGIHELHEAIGQLKKLYKFQFHFIGNIPERYRVKSPEIIYHGQLNNKEAIKAILDNADVLVCPSYAEGMPNVILEGMACQCAIIATDVGAVAAQVNERNGWLIEPGSSSSLQQALMKALEIPDQELLEKKKESVNRIRKEFLWDNIIFQVLDSFNKVIESSNGKA